MLGSGATVEATYPIQGPFILLLGILIASDMRLPWFFIAAISAAVGLCFGYYNGTAFAAAGASGTIIALQLIGIMVALFVLVAVFSAVVVSLRRDWTRIVVRVAGSWIAAIGLLLIGWAIHNRA